MALRKLDLMHRQFGKCHGHTCGECSNFTGSPGSYKKCKVYGISKSEASDWAKRWLACGMFNKPWDGNPIIRLVRPTRTDKEAQSIPLDVQLSWMYADMEEIIDG